MCWRFILGLAAVAAGVACDASPYRTATVNTRSSAGDRAPAAAEVSPTFRFAVAAIESPRDTYSAYTALFDRVGGLLGRRVQFEQRRTYREVNDLLIAGQLDAALLCTGGYLDLQRRAPAAIEVVAVPVVRGSQSFESLIIVSRSSGIHDLAGLRGHSFAFTDELSFSGRLYPVKVLRGAGIDPDGSFSSVTYTGSHDQSVQAVASGMVEGAAVHGGVLAQLEERDPSLQGRIRVIHRSPPLGAMPVVVSTRVPPEVRAQLREVLLALDRDPRAAATLQTLRFDRFVRPVPDLYATAARILDGR